MYDKLLSTDVQVYKIGNPDCFGAQAVLWYDGSQDYSGNPQLSNITSAQWMVCGISRLEPK